MTNQRPHDHHIYEPAPAGSSRRLIVELPLPAECLFPNKRSGNRYQLSRSKAKCRSDSKLATMQAMSQSGLFPPPFKSGSVRGIFYLARSRDMDNLNAWLKHYQDGLQDAGLIENDSRLVPLAPIIISGQRHTHGYRGVDLLIVEDEA